MTGADLAALLRDALPADAIAETPAIDMPSFVVDRDAIVEVCRRLRDDPSLQFSLLVDVAAVDYLPAEPRYEVVYHLASLGEAYVTGAAAAPPRRLRLKVRLPADDPRVATIVPVYPAAGWLEREVFDLFGITFEGHPDLRRILMPEDWEGYPLRKDAAVQIRRETTSWSPIQLTPEEFARNVRAEREGAAAQAAPQVPTESSRG